MEPVVIDDVVASRPPAQPHDPETLRWGPMRDDGRHFPLIGHRKLGIGAKQVYRRRRDLWAIYGQGRLDPQFREQIMLSAAAADDSRQCSFAHREWARAVGLPEEDLAALEGLDFSKFDDRRWAAFNWAQAYARNDLGEIPADVESNFRHHFDAQERADIELAARSMYWLNETSNTVDAFLARLRREPYPTSSAWIELLAIIVYAVCVPILITWLSLRQRRNPVTVFRAIRPFFREYEGRGPRTISGPGVRYQGTGHDTLSPG